LRVGAIVGLSAKIDTDYFLSNNMLDAVTWGI